MWTLEGVGWGLTVSEGSSEATGRVCELKRLWLLLLTPHKPLLVRAQRGSFPFSALSSERVPLVCLESLLPPPTLQCHFLCKASCLSTLLSKQFKSRAPCLLICLSHLDKRFSRLYPSLSQALVISPFLIHTQESSSETD